MEDIIYWLLDSDDFFGSLRDLNSSPGWVEVERRMEEEKNG